MRKRKTAITFWGTRGSTPSPGRNKSKYGGNTSCIELNLSNNQLIILDGGPGIRELGNSLVKKRKKINATILITHYHWDHIQGLPFFLPAYGAGNNFTIVGSNHSQFPLNKIFSSQMESIHFPVKSSALSARIKFKPLSTSNLRIPDTELKSTQVNHPGITYSYSITFDSHKIVYMTDNELLPCTHRGKSHTTHTREAFINFIQGADVLIHDAQYSEREYRLKKGWGHSSWKEAATLAAESEVKHLVLFHHDPDHDDRSIDAILQRCKAFLRKMRAPTKCTAAMEGNTICL